MREGERMRELHDETRVEKTSISTVKFKGGRKLEEEGR